MNPPQALTLLQLTQRIVRAVASAAIQYVWVVAETADMRVSNGHCYLDLVEKDSSGKQQARLRAMIWSNVYYAIATKFLHETGQQLRSDLKVMVCVTVNYHPLYGISAVINDINSAYTLGDVMQRRNRMLEQLRREGIIDMNRQLPWPAVPQRIAVISARGAAGYGDFINQLYNNTSRLRFYTRLFPAMMQGERTGASVVSALEAVAADPDGWDCVVIIRGGGATSDLLAFDDYNLAANIAQFPLPVIIGIGHERDVTLLDYVANMRVKTPTAAAEWLIKRGEDALGRLHATATAILQSVTDRINGCRMQIAAMQSLLPSAAENALMRARKRLDNARIVLASVADRRIAPQIERLTGRRRQIEQALAFAIGRERQRLDALAKLVDALSPQATLRRGYTMTRCDGHALRSAADLPEGTVIETVLADGTVLSRTFAHHSDHTLADTNP